MQIHLKFLKFIQTYSIIKSLFIFVLLSIAGFVHAEDTLFSQMFQTKMSWQLLPDFHDSYGVVFRDLNNDHKPDIYVVRFRNLNRLFLNKGNLAPFTDMTIHSGLGGNLMPRGQQNLELGASSVDFNNDGLADMVITGWGTSTKIFCQERGFHFTDISHRAELRHPLDGNGGFWADVNRDGDIDLFITDEHHTNRLLLGDGRGNFKDASREWGLKEKAVSQGASFSDIDRDGFPDLYVCNWFTPDVFYRNTGYNHFERLNLNLKHLTDSLNSNGATFGDIDNDGDLDLIVTDRNGQSALYRNDTNESDSLWIFTDITENANLNIPFPAYGSIIADLDNDGWQDIWISTVGPNIMFHNIKNGTFEKRFQESHKFINFSKYYSTGAAVADFDLDGDLDIFVSNKDTTSVLYVNPLNKRNFIQIKIVGVASNRDAIGTKIWLYPSQEKKEKQSYLGFREISGGSGYLSQNNLIAHFGVTSSELYDVRIIWPNGKEKQFNNLTPGNRYIFYEYDGFLALLYRGYNVVYLITDQPKFWLNLILLFFLIALITAYTIGSTKRYHWAVRHIIIYFSITIVLLYGISIGFQESPQHIRLTIQIISMMGLMFFLTFFMEKIRRLELTRSAHRRLLRNFSQELILIKNNQELFKKLVYTIYHTIQPAYCIIYEKHGDVLKEFERKGEYNGPQEILLSGEAKNNLLRNNINYFIVNANEIKNLKGKLFPISREEELYGLLVVGPLSDKRDFQQADIAIFRTLTIQTAIAIENNIYIEKTRELTQQVTEAKIQEKYLSELEKANQELERSNKELEKLYKDLKDTQTQLVQSEKMVSLGQVVAGVAHELNNPISYIYANMKELENYIKATNQLMNVLINDKDSTNFQEKLFNSLVELQEKYDIKFIQKDIQSLIRESLEGSRRVKEVVQNLRNFSRLDEAKFKVVDIHEGLNSTLLLLRNEIKDRITIQKDYGDLPKVYCHPGNINQVFMNILLNAIQAIENEGHIWISTRHYNGKVEIEIRDDGKGIPKEIQRKIFDPFFTTKQVGKGTGLGLSISYKIIKEHGGTIVVSSTKREGTSFKITLPVKRQ